MSKYQIIKSKKLNSVTKHKSQFDMSLLFNNLIQNSSTNNSYETIFWPKVPLCTSLVSHNFVWGTLYCSCMHFYASSSHSIMSLSIKMQGNIKTSGICLLMWSTEKGILYYSIIWLILYSINLSTILSKKN